MSAASPPKAAILVAADLRERIAIGEFSAGDPLPIEKDLESEYEMSTPVVRAALRILESHGLVDIRRGLGGGPRVRHPTVAEAAQGITLALQLEGALLSEVYEARDGIVAAALERLASSGADLCPLEEAVADLGAGVGDVTVYFRQLVEVGDVAVALAGNRADSILVTTLRHIVTADLATAALEYYEVTRREDIVATEAATARAWAHIVEHVATGDGAAARREYEHAAQRIHAGLRDFAPDTLVVDAVRARRR